MTGDMATRKQYPDLPAGQLWIFGYGSLMWNPGFEFSESAPARIFGFHRDLCLRSIVYRGTPARPGLVFGLVRGGSCVGRAFRVDPGNRNEVLDYLWRREMITHTYFPRQVRIYFENACRAGLTFVVDTAHPQFVSGLSDRQIAAILSGSRGKRGHNREYFLDSVDKFEDMGISTGRYHRIKRLIEKR